MQKFEIYKMEYYRHLRLSAFEWLQKNVNEAYTGNAVYQCC